jgi:hypothetical protein
MGEHIRIGARPSGGRAGFVERADPCTTHRTIEIAAQAELAAALGAARYARCDGRCGYRNGTRAGTVTGPTEPMASATTAIRATARAQGARAPPSGPTRLSFTSLEPRRDQRHVRTRPGPPETAVHGGRLFALPLRVECLREP